MTIVKNIKSEDGEYKFTVQETKGDGFCCKDCTGYYTMEFNKEFLLFEQGRFKFTHSEEFLVFGEHSSTKKTMSISKSNPLLLGSVLTSYKSKRQNNHMDLEAYT